MRDIQYDCTLVHAVAIRSEVYVWEGGVGEKKEL